MAVKGRKFCLRTRRQRKHHEDDTFQILVRSRDEVLELSLVTIELIERTG